MKRSIVTFLFVALLSTVATIPAQAADASFLTSEYLKQASTLADDGPFNRKVRQVQDNIASVTTNGTVDEQALKQAHRSLDELEVYVKESRYDIRSAGDVSSAVYFTQRILDEEVALERAESKRERISAHATIVQSVLASLSTQSDSQLGSLLREHLRYAVDRWQTDTGGTSAAFERYNKRAMNWLK